LSARAGTASLTELKLMHFTQGLDALKALVRWPAGLEKFSFEMPISGYYAGESALSYYSLAALQPILATQKATLSHIHIRVIFSQGLQGFNVTGFPNLQSLSLSRDLTGTDTTYVANLVAPRLGVFHWELTVEDQQSSEDLGGFGPLEEDWLRAFAAAAIARKSALRLIQIDYQPLDYYCKKASEPREYPWDRMDRIAREIRPHGISLSYSQPCMTREQFNKLLREET